VQSLPNTGGGVYALTLLGNQLFVIRHGARGIDIYDAASVPLTLSGCLPVPGLGPVSYGLAASSGPDRCLYVSDYIANRVHRVELADGGSEKNAARGSSGSGSSSNSSSSSADVATITEQRSWMVGTQPAGLSMTPTGRLLVTCYGAGEIQEYCCEGRRRGSRGLSAMTTMKMVRKVSLLPDVAYPWHAIRLSGNADTDVEQYVVTVSGTEHGVCLVGADGRIFRKFAGSGTGGGRRSAASSMKSPRCLVSVPGGSLAVADQCNNRILLVDQSLTRSHDLPTDSVGNSLAGAGIGGGSALLQLPGALSLDETHDRLYVGEWIGGRVLVFDGVIDYINAIFGNLTSTHNVEST
jgi:hypothetical protein